MINSLIYRNSIVRVINRLFASEAVNKRIPDSYFKINAQDVLTGMRGVIVAAPSTKVSYKKNFICILGWIRFFLLYCLSIDDKEN